MSFENGNKKDGKHYWLMPLDILSVLDQEFSFTFDPCPYPQPAGFDGLRIPWGKSNYVNPPFGSFIDQDGKVKGPTAWAKKSIDEYRKGNCVVMVYPIDKWILKLIEAGAVIRNMGDIHWEATEDRSRGPGNGRFVACFILDPNDKKK